MFTLKNIPIQNKLILASLLVVLPPLFAAGWLALVQTGDSGLNRARLHLERVRDIKRERLRQHLAERQREMGVLTHSAALLQTRNNDFDPAALHKIRDLLKRRLQTYFDQRLEEAANLATDDRLAQHVSPLDWIFRKAGNKAEGVAWTSRANRIAPLLEPLRDERGIMDLLVISSRGNIIFSLGRGPELGKNLKRGENRDNGLGRLFANALKGPVFQDFKPFTDGDGQPSAFIALPIRKNDHTVGVLALRLTAATTNRLTRLENNEDAARDVYLLGADARLRSNSLRNPKKRNVQADFAIADKDIQRSPLQETVLGGDRGSEVIGEKNGPRTAIAWETIRIADTTWRLVVEEDIRPSLTGFNPAGEGFLKKFLDLSGYYDLFLIRPDGHVFHTATRQADFGTNLITGPYADTNLGRLMRQVLKNKSFAITDVAPYPPSNDEPAAFMAQPLLRDGRVVMVVALQLPLESLTTAMHRADGPGTWSDAYLMGADGRLRSDSFLYPKDHSVTASFFASGDQVAKNANKALDSALNGGSGVTEGRDFKGRPVLTAYAPLALPGGVTWGVLVEAPLPGGSGPWTVVGGFPGLKKSLLSGGGAAKGLLLLLFALLLAVVVARLLAGHLAGPIIEGAGLLTRLAGGESIAEPDAARRDELGDLNHAIAELSHGFSGIGSNIGDSADKVVDQSLKLALNARGISQQAAKQTALINETGQYLEKLAEHLLRDAKEAQAIGTLSENANTRAGQSGRAIIKAMETLKEIAEKTFIIVETARQTNLLSMKAGVEAARAGKRGKAFADLAEEIRRQAERIRNTADEIGTLSLTTVRSGRAAGAMLSEMGPDFEKTAKLARRVAASSQNRSREMERVHTNVRQLEQTLNEGIRAAGSMIEITEALSNQGDSLWKEISRLKPAGEKKPQPADTSAAES